MLIGGWSRSREIFGTCGWAASWGYPVCGAVANCSAGGIYDLANNPASEQAFLVSEK